MPTRNIMVVTLALLVSLACYSVSSRNRYARLIAEALEIVHHEALVNVPERKLFDAAMNGMLRELDENSGFISQDRFQTFDESINQEFVGVGMTINADQNIDYVQVISPIPGTPAFHAGIKVADRILEIDGISTSGISQQQAIDMIRGPKGEDVVFLIQRDVDDEVENVMITVTRDSIAVPSVYGDTRDGNGSWNLFLHDHPKIGYLRLSQFGKRSTEEMQTALSSLEDADALILDLRNNPGGLLDTAVEISDMFIDRDVLVVQTKQRDGRVVKRHYATSKTVFNPKRPMAVLVNQLSASAAEIVAACLQDHRRAVIIGTQTYGKGTVQDLIPLEPHRSLIRLTTASYWRPSGKNIDRTVLQPPNGQYGVTPNPGFEVLVSNDEFDRINRLRFERDQMTIEQIDASNPNKTPWEFSDPQLKKAVDHLNSLIGQSTAA